MHFLSLFKNNHIDGQAYDFVCEVLRPIDEILDKIAEMNSFYGIRLHGLKLEKNT